MCGIILNYEYCSLIKPRKTNIPQVNKLQKLFKMTSWGLLKETNIHIGSSVSGNPTLEISIHENT